MRVAGFDPRETSSYATNGAHRPHKQPSFAGPLQRGKRSAVLTYRYTPCYAMRVTFFEGRPKLSAPSIAGADIFELP